MLRNQLHSTSAHLCSITRSSLSKSSMHKYFMCPLCRRRKKLMTSIQARRSIYIILIKLEAIHWIRNISKRIRILSLCSFFNFFNLAMCFFFVSRSFTSQSQCFLLFRLFYPITVEIKINY